MAGIIFTSTQEKGAKISDILEGSRPCEYELRITDPNAHLKTHAHWILGWIPPKTPKASNQGRFEGRAFYAFKVWIAKGYKRYWGYTEFDGRKNYGWIDGIDVGQPKPIKASKKKKHKSYEAYTRDVLRRLKVAWRYRVPYKVPKDAYGHVLRGQPRGQSNDVSDEAWDNLDKVNKVPVRAMLRIPLSKLTQRVSTAEQQRFEREHYEGNPDPQKPESTYCLQVYRNPWDGTKPFKRVRDLYRDSVRVDIDWDLVNFEEKPKKKETLIRALIRDGSPIVLEKWLGADQILMDKGLAEFVISVRWAGTLGGQNWVLGHVDGDWAFIKCPDFNDPHKFEINPKIDANDRKFIHTLKHSKYKYEFVDPGATKAKHKRFEDLVKKAVKEKDGTKKKKELEHDYRKIYDELKDEPYWQYFYYCQRRVQVMKGPGIISKHASP